MGPRWKWWRRSRIMDEQVGVVECPRRFIEPRFTKRWGYQPQPGFRVERIYEHPSMYHLTNTTAWLDLGAALMWFAETHLPAEVGASATIKDRTGTVVFGWSYHRRLHDDLGAPAWYGVREAFRIAETLPCFDMLDLAVWEATAMRTADR